MDSYSERLRLEAMQKMEQRSKDLVEAGNKLSVCASSVLGDLDFTARVQEDTARDLLAAIKHWEKVAKP